MSAIPTLVTDRLTMRGWREQDLDAYAVTAADPAVARYTGGIAARDDAWRQLAMFVGHWRLRGYGLWVVERRGEGAFLGRVGLWRPEGWPGLEVGWALAREAWGHGYATEAARAAIYWAWENLPAEQLISLIHPGNDRSQRVANRLGMQPGEQTTVRDHPAIVYTLKRPKPGH